MHQCIADRKDAIAAACRQFGIVRLEVFGSAARASDFDVTRSDTDLLVDFGHWTGPDPYTGFKTELERLLSRRVDLLDSKALNASRNYLRRAAIAQEAELIFEA